LSSNGESGPRAGRGPALMLTAILAALAVLGLRTDRPPAPVDVDAAAAEFSAARARVHLRAITQAPHPVGSAAHAEVRQYLLDTLIGMGLSPQVQSTTAMSPYVDNYGADVHNIVARIPGTDSTGAILLLAHYDSVMGSFGASDDGAGVSAILESVRAVQARGLLRNDLIVLISDAEEVGLLGAFAFVGEHPWFEDVAVVLNVEARGSYGASYMFQTTGPNGRTVAALAHSTPRPIANTVMQEVYGRLPNGTDLSAFMGTAVEGMDFAYIRGLSHYHTPLDNFETQDPASLQHHGSYLTGIAGALGNVALDTPAGPELTYFNVGPLGFARYSAGWILPLAVLTLLIALGFIGKCIASGSLRIPGVAVGLVSATLSVAASVGVAQLGWGRLAAVSESVRWDSYRLFYDSAPYLFAFCAMTVALVTLAVWISGRWASVAELAAGPVVVWSALAVAAAICAPGASYLFVWAALGGVGATFVVRADEPANWAHAAALGVLAAPALLVTAPWVRWLEVAMTMRLVAASVGLLALILIILTPQLGTVVRRSGWRVPVASLVVAMFALGWGLLTPEYDEQKKRLNQVSYVADLDTGEAYWYSSDPEVDSWTSILLGSDPEMRNLSALGLGRRTYLTRQTQALPLVGAQAVVVEDTTDGAIRSVELRLTLPAGAHRTVVELMPGSTIPLTAELNGNALVVIDAGADTPTRLLAFVGAPAEGVQLRLTLAPDAPLILRALTITPGLPGDTEPRPADTMSRGDVTALLTTVRLP